MQEEGSSIEFHRIRWESQVLWSSLALTGLDVYGQQRGQGGVPRLLLNKKHGMHHR